MKATPTTVSSEIVRASTRVATTEALLRLMDRDPKVVVVLSDSLLVLKGQPLRAAHPDRVFDVGIAEQNGVDVAAGLASCGLVPFFATYAGFITMRACEQVRTFVGYSGLNVKLVGANGGVGAGEREGPTHQFFEDLAITRTIPGMTVVCPADAAQVRLAIDAVARIEGPAYVRIGSGRDPVVFHEEQPFELGKARVIARYGADVALVGCGSILRRVLIAAQQLRENGVGATVVEVHTIKPIDAPTLVEVAHATGTIVTVEDHTVIGGLGSAVAECLSQEYPVPIVRLGIKDSFARSGDSEEVLDYCGLSIDAIVESAWSAVAKKNVEVKTG